MSWQEVGEVEEVDEEVEVKVQEVEDGKAGIVDDPNRLGCK